jgi:hypothetical protein
MSERTIISSGIALLLALFMLVLWQRWHRDPQNRMVPPLVITIVGGAVLLYSYIWAFDFSSCTRGRIDFVCGLNQNQGILTFVTLLIAVIAIWVTLLADENRRREEATTRQKHVTTLIQLAVREANHNLIHMAAETTPSGSFKGVPQLSVIDATTLYSPSMAGSFSPVLINYAETLVRVREMIERAAEEFPVNDPKRKISRGMDGRHIPEHLELVQLLQSFTINSLKFLLRACNDHSEALQEFMTKPGRQDFPRILEASAKAMARNSAMTFDSSYYLVYRSSLAKGVAQQLRLQEVPLVCWVETGKFQR